jgi:hypothetical protein
VLLALTGIVAGGLLFGAFVEWAGAPFRFPEAAFRVAAVRAGMRPTVLFLGSSRFSADVREEDVSREIVRAVLGRQQRVMNAWVAFGDPVAMDFVSARVTDAGARPEVVVIEVSPETLSHRNFAIDVHLIRQLTWTEMPAALPDVIRAKRIGHLLGSRLNPAYHFRNEVQAWLTRPIASPYLWGIPGPEPDEPGRWRVLLAGAALAAQRLQDFAIGGLSASRLERLIERHRAQGAAVVLLAPPASSPFRSQYRAPIDTPFLAHMHELERRHGVRYVEYRDRMPDERFSSTYYLSDVGAIEFSRLIAREVLVPALAAPGVRAAAASGAPAATPR